MLFKKHKRISFTSKGQGYGFVKESRGGLIRNAKILGMRKKRMMY